MRLLKILGVVLFGVLSCSQSGHAQASKKYWLFQDFDVDSLTLTYGKFLGDSTAQESGRRITIPIETSGSSATTTASTAATLPFANVAEHDWIAVRTANGTTLRRLVTAKADGDSITVASAWDLGTAGLPFSWWDHTTGTGAEDGWVTVSDMQAPVTVGFAYNQGDLGSLNMRVECRVLALQTSPVIVYPGEADTCGTGGTLSGGYCNFVTAGENTRLQIDVYGHWDQCRVGVAYVTSDTSDVTTNREQVSAYIVGAGR